MTQNECTIEVFIEGTWRPAATLTLNGPAELGRHVPSMLIYLTDYALDHLGHRGAFALSATTPVSLKVESWKTWPPFLVDLLPQGFGRQELATRLGIPPDSPSSDWPLLCHGAANPIGNLRIHEAALDLGKKTTQSKGFSEQEISERSENFIEYLASEGLYIAGSSGVQGEWPKVLLTQDASGVWHLDHLLPDAAAVRHCLVKFVKNEKPVFEEILQLERVYYELARHLGLFVHAKALSFIGKALFIDRFDRRWANNRLERVGQESLFSLLSKIGFNDAVTHNDACIAIAQHSSAPLEDVIEYVLRDVANVALGNRDNHGRNTAFQRFEDGTVRISPLYDFAPMFLHPDGIARRIRWRDNDGGAPEWTKVAMQAAETLKDSPIAEILEALTNFAPKLAQLPQMLTDYGVSDDIRRRLEPGILANLVKLHACAKREDQNG